MRRLEFQINQVRNSTDNKDVNGISNAEVVGYFNDAQKYITTLIFKNNPYADVFKTQVEFDANTTGIYILPSDCYSINSISMVEGRFSQTQNNNGYTRIRPIGESEFSYIFGYMIRDNSVNISGQNTVQQLQKVRITYFRQLKTLDVRQGFISVATPTQLTLTTTPTDLYVMDDHLSTVDVLGDQIVAGVRFTNTSGAILTVVSPTSAGTAAGQWVVAGINACNKSELPDVCEPYLLDYVKQRIYTRNNYSDAEKQLYFTEQQKSEIISIFSKNKKDEDTIPITDASFLLF
jgi:hypothetical protein